VTTVNFETEECCVCGVLFQVTEEFSEDRQADGATFYCPNGHGQNYADSDEGRIKALEAENRDQQIEIRQLKCRLLRQVGVVDRVRMWWKGGLA